MEIIINFDNIKEIGKKIRTHLKKGIILSISGELGIGKTTLIKHILPEYNVSSPSFLHVLLYEDNLSINDGIAKDSFAHIDAYTFKSKEALLSMGIEEMLETRCVIVEWGNLFEDILKIFDAKIIYANLRFENNARILNIDINL